MKILILIYYLPVNLIKSEFISQPLIVNDSSYVIFFQFLFLKVFYISKYLSLNKYLYQDHFLYIFQFIRMLSKLGESFCMYPNAFKNMLCYQNWRLILHSTFHTDSTASKFTVTSTELE